MQGELEEESLKTEMGDGLEAGAGTRERNDEAPGLARANPRSPPSLLPNMAGLPLLDTQVVPRTSASGQEGV